MEGYIFTLMILELLLSVGLSQYISLSTSLTNPALTTPVFLSGAVCVHDYLGICADWLYNIGIGIYYFFYNIYFLLTLSFISSTFGFLGWIFTFMTIIFSICILLVIRG
jgi:hypothetical protein